MPTPKGQRQGGDHWWINPDGLSKAQKDQLRRATSGDARNRTTDGKQGSGRGGREKLPPGALPDQYIGKGKDAKRAAEKIAKTLKGAKVYSSNMGSSSAGQTLWTRLAHRIIDAMFKGKK